MTTLVSNATTPAELLRETRGAAGLTTREIAPMVGVSPGTVSNWERGLSEPTMSQFVLWALATKQAPEQLLQGLIEMVRPKGLEPLTFCSVAEQLTEATWTERDDLAFQAYAILMQLEDVTA